MTLLYMYDYRKCVFFLQPKAETESEEEEEESEVEEEITEAKRVTVICSLWFVSCMIKTELENNCLYIV